MGGFIGNSTVNSSITTNQLIVGANSTFTIFTSNATGLYANATLIANSTGPYGKTEATLAVASATNASAATNATYATSADSATNATYATSAGSATNATYATSAGSATNATYATSAGAVSGGKLIPSTTRMVFQQTAAPTGFTKDTTYNNYAMRIVSGAVSTGGSVAFTTAFASQTPSGSISTSVSGTVGSTTLALSQVPSHNHNAAVYEGAGGYPAGSGNLFYSRRGDLTPQPIYTNSQGGGGSHNHTFSGSGSSTFTGNAINLAVQYVDFIIATAN